MDIARKKPNAYLRHEIEMRMQDVTDNEYWRLSATERRRFEKLK